MANVKKRKKRRERIRSLVERNKVRKRSIENGRQMTRQNYVSVYLCGAV